MAHPEDKRVTALHMLCRHAATAYSDSWINYLSVSAGHRERRQKAAANLAFYAGRSLVSGSATAGFALLLGGPIGLAIAGGFALATAYLTWDGGRKGATSYRHYRRATNNLNQAKLRLDDRLDKIKTGILNQVLGVKNDDEP